MSIQVHIYDYVEESGHNPIASWLDGIGPRPKAKINNILNDLAEIPQQDWYQWSKVFEKLIGSDDLCEVTSIGV